jgi:hypothetical protein
MEIQRQLAGRLVIEFLLQHRYATPSVKPQQNRYQGASRHEQPNGRVRRELSQSCGSTRHPPQDAVHHDIDRFVANGLHGRSLRPATNDDKCNI